MEDVGWSSRQDDPITGEGAHEHAAGDTEAGDTRIDPILYRYATTYKSGLIFQCICHYQKFIRAIPTKYFAGATSAVPICNIPDKIVSLVPSSGNKPTPRGNTVLHLAASTDHLQLIKLIALNFPGLVRKQNDDGELPLHVAASVGHLSAVHCLVDTAQGNMFNEKDGRGNTSLHVAVENNHQEVAMFLVGKDGSTLILQITPVKLPCALLIGFLTSMQIESKSYKILARIQGCCSIDAHARSFSSRTIWIIYVETIPN